MGMKIIFLIWHCTIISRVVTAPFFGHIKDVLLRNGYTLVTEATKIPHLIYPGTNYCGLGNVARRFDDLGDQAQIDACCRSHDYCTQYIEPKKNNFNLYNDDIFSRVNCDCDKAFYDCLKSVNTKHSDIIGNIYFNILGRTRQCFKRDYPPTKCKKYVVKYLSRRCIEYEYNTTTAKIYQWFDIPIFE